MRGKPVDIESYRGHFVDVCDMISCDFITVKNAIAQLDNKIPYWLFRKMQREDDQCKKLWENAKLDQTHYGDDIQTDMINESIRGERDTKDAMHISTMIKWKMEKFNPRQYGDRAAIVTEECVDRLNKFIDSETNGKS